VTGQEMELNGDCRCNSVMINFKKTQ